MTYKPFDHVNSINNTKKNLIEDETSEKGYNPFLTNRALSYHVDSLLYANDMNMLSILDNKLQYDYYLHGLKKSKRYSKWHKFEPSEKYEIIKEYYKYNDKKTKEVMNLLNDSQIMILKNKMFKGDQ